MYRKRIERQFDRQARVLSPEDIAGLAGDGTRLRALKIFRSAVVDHVPVEGWPYHLHYPVNPIFYHDGFKRAQIAVCLAQMQDAIGDPQAFAEAEPILATLVDPQLQPGYVVVLAWQARGLWYRERALTPACLNALEAAIGGTVPAVLGALLFLDVLRGNGREEEAAALLNAYAPAARYRLQRALIAFHRGGKKTAHPADLSEAFRQIGLYQPGQSSALWQNTPHQETARGVMRAAGDYLSCLAVTAR